MYVHLESLAVPITRANLGDSSLCAINEGVLQSFRWSAPLLWVKVETLVEQVNE